MQTFSRGCRGYTWSFSGVASYEIARAGSRISWSTLRCGQSADAVSLLCGPVLGFALQLQGTAALHGNALGFEGRAFGILGRSGSGKSTLAAALLGMGCAMISDDTLRAGSHGGRHWLSPGPQRLKLWPDSLRKFGWTTSGVELPAYVSWLDKRLVAPASFGRSEARRLPLAALYVLSPAAAGAAAGIERLTGHQALISLSSHSYQAHLLAGEPHVLAGQLRRFSLLAAQVPVFALFAPRCFEKLEPTAAAVLRHFCDLARQGG